MPLEIIRNDITKMDVDAIVNAANESLLGGGGVDGMIHRAAGVELLDECRTLGGCSVGQAKLTRGYKLKARYVIHTVGPRYVDGKHGEKALLESCYRRSLELADKNGFQSVAFPLISSGIYGYPKDEALRVAIDVIGEFLFSHEMTVYVVIFDKASYKIGTKLFDDIKEFIDDNYVEENRILRRNAAYASAAPQCPKQTLEAEACFDEAISPSLDDRLKDLDESFSEMLLRMIDERGMTDAECYKKANVDRKHFSKIRSDVNYRPSKQTAIAFAISLELSLEETEDLLKKAGFALSHSNKFDIIIEFFITNGNYNIYEINEALFAFDQSLLGA